MPLYEPTVPGRYALLLLDYLREAQHDWLDAAVAEAGIDPDVLGAPNADLTIGQFDALWEAVTRRSGRSDLAFELGLRITPATHGAVGMAFAHCTTFDEIWRLAARYSRLITPSAMLQYRREGGQGELLWRPAAGMSGAVLRAGEEIHLVSSYMLLKRLLGERLAPFDVYVHFPRPAHAERYRRLRPQRVHFGAGELPEVRFVFDGAMLDLPLAVAAGDGASGHDLSGLQDRVGKATQWRDWVHLMLREAEGCLPSQAQLAELLSVSPHTLARRLAQEGCNYRALAMAVRHQRACELLLQGRQSIATIGVLLGYGDATNFTHAFRKWSGLSPRAYRQQNGCNMNTTGD